MAFIPFDELWEEVETRFHIAPNWANSTTQELLDGFVYFCREYWHIRHPTRGRVKFDLSQAQIDTALGWIEHRYTIILKARQLGFSTLAGAFAVWCSYFYDNRYIVMLSRTERDAIKLLAKSKYGFKYLPEWMKARGPIWESTQTKLSFSNESNIESLPSGNEPARGETVWLMFLDEWAFLTNPAEAWAAAEASTDLGGRVVGLSTANGEGNIFHEFWAGSSAPFGAGVNRWHSMFYPWWADGAGMRDQAWYDEKAKDTPDWQMAQEYPDNPEEAFLRSGRPMFKLDALRKIDCVEPANGFLIDVDGRVEFREDGGNLHIWEHPVQGGIYTIGADVAEGLEHGDYSSVHVIDARRKRLVATWHGHIDPDLFGVELLPLIGRYFNNCLIGVESNNHGISTLKGLQRAGYSNIFVERPHTKRTAVPTEKLGFRTTQTSKPLIIDGLGAVLRDATLWMVCAKTLQELKTFVREGDGKMHGSPYDDRTMSLAIAVHMLLFAFLDEYKPAEEFPVGSMGWLEQMLYKDESKTDSTPLGSHSVRIAS